MSNFYFLKIIRLLEETQGSIFLFRRFLACQIIHKISSNVHTFDFKKITVMTFRLFFFL